MIKRNLIQDKSFQFSLKVIKLYKILKEQNEFVISKQILRSSTSIGANIEEALAGSSKKDFLFKMTISLKEARETRYWLRLLNESQLVKYNYSQFLLDIEDIINIMTKIVKTTAGSLKK